MTPNVNMKPAEFDVLAPLANGRIHVAKVIINERGHYMVSRDTSLQDLADKVQRYLVRFPERAGVKGYPLFFIEEMSESEFNAIPATAEGVEFFYA